MMRVCFLIVNTFSDPNIATTSISSSLSVSVEVMASNPSLGSRSSSKSLQIHTQCSIDAATSYNIYTYLFDQAMKGLRPWASETRANITTNPFTSIFFMNTKSCDPPTADWAISWTFVDPSRGLSRCLVPRRSRPVGVGVWERDY